VRDAFVARLDGAASCFEPNERGRWQADLYALARRFLAAEGVTAVYGGELCTHADETRFFSYRRDGATGRMASFIARVETA
jgi:copper oxidase (laccase) domain-containing protein